MKWSLVPQGPRLGAVREHPGFVGLSAPGRSLVEMYSQQLLFRGASMAEPRLGFLLCPIQNYCSSGETPTRRPLFCRNNEVTSGSERFPPGKSN